MLTGVFADASLGGKGLAEGMSIGSQVLAQAKGVLFTIVYTAIASFILLKLVDLVVGLRVNEEEETMGLDLASHDERGYVL
jgi:Amt family ammonium transporter